MLKKIITKIFRGLTLSLVICLLVITSRNFAFADITTNYQDLKYPPLPRIQLPEYDRYQLENGIVVYLVEDHRLPLISANAVINTGSRFEPNNQVGLAEITGNLIRTGGTKKHTPEELSDILELKAASIETSISQSSGSASFSALSYDLDSIFPLFAEILQQPQFEPEKLAFLKTQFKGAIARRNDNPSNVANREFGKLIYGNDSPYARTVEYSTLDNITRVDVIDFYRQYIRPENMMLGIVGDFEPATMKSLINQYFANWQVDSPLPSFEQIPQPTQVNKQDIYLID